MVEKTNQSESNPNGSLSQLDLLRNILFGEFTSKYEKRLELLEQKIEKLNTGIKENKKDFELQMAKVIKETDAKMSKAMKESETKIDKEFRNTDTKLNAAVKQVEGKCETYTNNLSKQIDVRFIENRNTLSSEIRKVEEEKEDSMAELANLFVDLAAKIKKL